MNHFWHSFRNIRGFHSYRERLLILSPVVDLSKKFCLEKSQPGDLAKLAQGLPREIF